MPEMTSQLAMDVVSMPELAASSWLNTVGHLSYVHGVKTLLITPVFSPHAPVRMDDHDGLETVVCPAMLAAAVVPPWITLKKLALVGSASTLLRFVPSTPISSTFGVSSASTVIACGDGVVALRRRVFRSISSRSAARAASITGAWIGGDSGLGSTSG